MIQLLALALAFIITLSAVLSGVTNIQESVGNYRNQLSAEGFEGLSVGYLTFQIDKADGLIKFLKAKCGNPNALSYSQDIQGNCLETQFQTIFGFPMTVDTNDLREHQGLPTIKGDLSSIQFSIKAYAAGAEWPSFTEVTGTTNLMRIAYVEIKAVVRLPQNGELKDLWRFHRVVRQ